MDMKRSLRALWRCVELFFAGLNLANGVRIHMRAIIGVFLFSWLASACVSPLASPDAAPPNDLLWVRTSAEKTAIYEQVYRLAEDRLPALAAGHGADSWAVVMDADETVLDNSEYQLRLARAGQTYTDATWAVWVSEQKAPELPGARRFIEKVHALGGKVIIVTNRLESECDATRVNFLLLKIQVEGILCAPPGVTDKNPRYDSIRAGTSGLELPPLEVVAFVGDNIQDFPAKTQRNPGSFGEFGRSLFILPNPIYGSWTTNALQ